ncbi:hypothetical protein TIFTF001_027993 [Ficus carica]|uniref:Uncharacterized protein n=1 Tax=Ficus carica TaxID=3494 RepID=A0AA88DP66_FICCA|nr:hypothetical protein TIFTF001_027993 [Ficus carica]
MQTLLRRYLELVCGNLWQKHWYDQLHDPNSLKLVADLLTALVNRWLLLLRRSQTWAMMALRSDLTDADENTWKVRLAMQFGFPRTHR